MGIIFHITDKKNWEQGRNTGEIRADSLETEGFIHCSREHQLAGVIERYFQGARGLILLVIDESTVREEIKYEPAGSDPFPHIYGPLNRTAVLEAVVFDVPQGVPFTLPAAAQRYLLSSTGLH